VFAKHAVFTLLATLITGLNVMVVSCGWQSSKQEAMIKAGSLLMRQIELRQKQIASPDAERLKQMQDMGMMLDDLKSQRIFVYMKAYPSDAQQKELKEMSIKLYLDSWIPQVGNNPNGFFIADMPVDRLQALAACEFVIKLDSAEGQSGPQGTVNRSDR
jgi:hypothetical protein